MALYKEQIGTGTTWTRCKTVQIENPLTGTPFAHFIEARCASVGGMSSEQFSDTLHKSFDPVAEIPMRNPETGELTGSVVTQDHLYQILYSLYMQAALDRDAGQS